MTKSKRYASPSEIIKIYERLESLLNRIDDGVQYPSGYNDTTVSKEFGVSPYTVGRVRKEMFGDLVNKELTLETRVYMLEKYISTLEPDWRKKIGEE